MKRHEMLEKAKECVCGQRETDYGTPEDNFKTIADFVSVYLKAAHGVILDITAKDVAMMMSLLKIARIATGSSVDSFVDLAGYAACGCEIVTEHDDPRGEPGVKGGIVPNKILAMENENLKANNELIREKYDDLIKDFRELTEDNEKLKAENARLTKENEILKESCEKLQAENDVLKSMARLKITEPSHFPGKLEERIEPTPAERKGEIEFRTESIYPDKNANEPELSKSFRELFKKLYGREFGEHEKAD